MAKSENMNIRVAPDVKAMIEADAKARSLSAASFLLLLYAEWRIAENRKNATKPEERT